MKLNNDGIKQNLIQRLKRLEGQIRGVQNMVAEERDCREIMQQLSAAHAAIQSLSRVFFRDYAAACMAELDAERDESNNSERRERMLQEMITLLDKTP